MGYLKNLLKRIVRSCLIEHQAVITNRIADFIDTSLMEAEAEIRKKYPNISETVVSFFIDEVNARTTKGAEKVIKDIIDFLGQPEPKKPTPEKEK